MKEPCRFDTMPSFDSMRCALGNFPCLKGDTPNLSPARSRSGSDSGLDHRTCVDPFPRASFPGRKQERQALCAKELSIESRLPTAPPAQNFESKS